MRRRFDIHPSSPGGKRPGGAYEIDPLARSILTREDLEVGLTGREMQILAFLDSGPNKGARRSEIVSEAWKNTRIVSKTFDVHIFNLRRKLAALMLDIEFIKPDIYAVVCRAGPKKMV